AGEMAAVATDYDEAQLHYDRAIELLRAEGQTQPTARVLARLGFVEFQRGQLEPAIERMENAFSVLSADEPDADFAAFAAELGRLHFFNGNLERSSELIDIALSLGEGLQLPEVVAAALNTYGVIATWRDRLEMALALYSHSLKLALENDLPTSALRAYNNLGDNPCVRDRYEEALSYHDSGVALARKVGNRQWEYQLIFESTFPLAQTGRWDEAIARVDAVPESQLATLAIPPEVVVEIEVARGRVGAARRFLSVLPDV